MITTNEGGMSITGKSVETYRLLSLASAVSLEAKGLKLRRGFSATKMAKETTGLKTNDRAKLIAALKAMADANERDAKAEEARSHTKDADCTVVDGSCTVCLVHHGSPCRDCDGRGYHTANCFPEWAQEPYQKALLRIAASKADGRTADQTIDAYLWHGGETALTRARVFSAMRKSISGSSSAGCGLAERLATMSRAELATLCRMAAVEVLP